MAIDRISIERGTAYNYNEGVRITPTDSANNLTLNWVTDSDLDWNYLFNVSITYRVVPKGLSGTSSLGFGAWQQSIGMSIPARDCIPHTIPDDDKIHWYYSLQSFANGRLTSALTSNPPLFDFPNRLYDEIQLHVTMDSLYNPGQLDGLQRTGSEVVEKDLWIGYIPDFQITELYYETASSVVATFQADNWGRTDDSFELHGFYQNGVNILRNQIRGVFSEYAAISSAQTVPVKPVDPLSPITRSLRADSEPYIEVPQPMTDELLQSNTMIIEIDPTAKPEPEVTPAGIIESYTTHDASADAITSVRKARFDIGNFSSRPAYDLSSTLLIYFMTPYKGAVALAEGVLTATLENRAICNTPALDVSFDDEKCIVNYTVRDTGDKGYPIAIASISLDTVEFNEDTQMAYPNILEGFYSAPLGKPIYLTCTASSGIGNVSDTITQYVTTFEPKGRYIITDPLIQNYVVLTQNVQFSSTQNRKQEIVELSGRVSPSVFFGRGINSTFSLTATVVNQNWRDEFSNLYACEILANAGVCFFRFPDGRRKRAALTSISISGDRWDATAQVTINATEVD